MKATSHVVQGYLRCPGCRYALRGQPIMHLDDYDLHGIRCPECGRVTPAREPLLLGGWEGRLSILLALLWVLLTAGVWMAANGAAYGFCRATAEAAGDEYRNYLDDQFRASMSQGVVQQPAIQSGARVTRFFGSGNFPAWWKTQDPDALLAGAGGWAAAVDWRMLIIWLPLGLVSLNLGMLMSVIFYRFKRLGLIIRVPLFLGPLLGFMAVTLSGWDDQTIFWAGSAAYQQLGRPILLMSVVASGVALTVGLLIGRPIARWLMRLTLPPRARMGVEKRLEA